MSLSRRPRPLSIALATAALLGGGCSYMTRTPPPQTMTSPAECSGSSRTATADVVLALETGSVALLALAGAAIQEGWTEQEVAPSWDPHSRVRGGARSWLVFGLASTAVTAAFVQSARYGYRTASECREAQVRLLFPASFAPPDSLPPGYPPPAAPPARPDAALPPGPGGVH